MSDAWAARAAAGIAIASWRSAEGLEDPEFAERDLARLYPVLRQIIDTGFDEAAAPGQRTPAGAASRDELIHRRAEAFGPAVEPLTYDEPLFIDHASGVWMYDANGDRFLDAYNNVPCVGHAHPRVTEAIARQSRVVNTHLRYLHPAAIELAERLIATCPPGLDTVLYVNSGSEANDLAWRLATHVTGGRRGAVHALRLPRHLRGDRAAVARGALHRPDQRARRALATPPMPTAASTWTPPSSRPPWPGWRPRGSPPAAVILDGVLQSDGVQVLTPEYVGDLVRRTHDAGALWIADEVQGGHGRTGEAMWSFQRFGIDPDFVTLGKPMGNGHPVAAVITRREFLEGFADETVVVLDLRRQPGLGRGRPRRARRSRGRAGAAAGRHRRAKPCAQRSARRPRTRRASARSAAWGWPTAIEIVTDPEHPRRPTAPPPRRSRTP